MGFFSYDNHLAKTLDNEQELNEYLETIKFNFLRKEDTIDRLMAEVKTLKDKHYKDAEMATMKQQLDKARGDLTRGFPISAEEKTKIALWQTAHNAAEHNNNHNTGAAGGRYSYRFYPTGIGTIGECVCGSCEVKAREAAIRKRNWSEYQKYIDEHNVILEFQGLD